VRIGVSTVKGLCWASGIPACGVSTLEAMAYGGRFAPEGALICCAMDARRNEVYNALFVMENDAPKRLCPDRALALSRLTEELKAGTYDRFYEKCIFTVGDGALLCYNHLLENGLSVMLAPEPVRYQSAWGVAMAAESKPAEKADAILPVYLRLSQAERERQARMDKEIKSEGN